MRAGQGHEGRGFSAPPAGLELAGRRLLLLGFGGIGRRVARIASHGFGMRVVATGRRDLDALARDEMRSREAFLRQYGLESYATDPAPELPKADVVSIHMVSNAQARRYVDKDGSSGISVHLNKIEASPQAHLRQNHGL